MSILQVKNLSKSFGTVQALKGVSFTVRSGTVVGLIGPNGAGKTTLLKCILGLVRYERGEIFLDGRPLAGRKELAAQISYIPEQPVYYEELTVEENLSLYAMLAGTPRREFAEKKAMLVKELDLAEHLKKLPDQLSKGNRQKMMIAMAFFKRFQMLLADEPFSGLDPVMIRRLKDLFLAVKEEEKTVLISTHLLDLAQTICDDYIFLDHGNILAAGNREEIRRAAGIPGKEGVSLEEAYLKLLGRSEGS
ncbi:MAG: ABC transporter ATP-binding protein [Firmicutes bacterium]|nr:ABC transporter ATP-binding protein [Bacillota bacterium]